MLYTTEGAHDTYYVSNKIVHGDNHVQSLSTYFRSESELLSRKALFQQDRAGLLAIQHGNFDIHLMNYIQVPGLGDMSKVMAGYII